MRRVRVLGLRACHGDVVHALQDAGVLHLAPPPPDARLSPLRLSNRQEREHRYLRRALVDVETTIEGLGLDRLRAPEPGAVVCAGTPDFARWARLGRRLRPQVAALRARLASLEEERVLILKYRPFLAAFGLLLRGEGRWPHVAAYHALLRREEAAAVAELRTALQVVIGDAFALLERRLPSGEIALLLLAPARVASQVEALLERAAVQEVPVPAGFGGGSLAEAAPGMLERLEAIPDEQAEVARRLDHLASEHGADLLAARTALHDRLRELDAVPMMAASERAFVIEGWVPADCEAELCRLLAERCGTGVVVESSAVDAAAPDEVPVELANRSAVRPFEAIVRLLPLPHYGTIDPTPFMAFFFPLFFGMMLGDVAYALGVGVLSWLLWRRGRGGGLLRSAAVIAAFCAVSAAVFGLLFGEVAGDLGRSWFGLQPLLMDREEGLLLFLIVAVGVGLVHVVLGLVLGVVSARRTHPRQAVSRAATAAVVLLVPVVLLAGMDRLPDVLLMPALIGMGVAAVVALVAEGVVAAIELVGTFGNILSYARLMALGTASVMLAVVANRMGEEMGSALLGVAVALIFHIVNFVLGCFSPTIQAVRLHFVEFFGKFYSPGGRPYRPFTHWDARTGRT